MTSGIDHLVIAATSLESPQLEAFVGRALSPGGRHSRMGTHNRVLRLGAGIYLELMAVDPAGRPERARWFELDDPAMQARLAAGPRLVHWVARVDTTELPPLPFDPGPWESFQRGDFSWQMTVRSDGTMPAEGVVPTLICWKAGSAHPTDRLPDSGVSLEALELEHPRAVDVQRQLDLLGLELRCKSAVLPGIVARLRTPAGPRTLRSTEPLR